MGFYQTDQVRQNPTDEAKAKGKGKWWRWRYVKKIFFSFAKFGQVLFVLVFIKKSHTDHRLHLNSKGYFLFYLFQFANFGQVSVGTYYQKEVTR